MTSSRQLEPYQRVVAATGLSNLADGIRVVALPLVAFEVSGSAFVVALVVAASLAPWLVLGIWAGAVVDRSARKHLAQRTALARAGFLSLLGVLILAGNVPLPILIISALVLGASEVFADNVNSVLIPSLVEPDDLERANSQMVGAEIVGNELIGPAIGGLLFAAAAALPFFTNAGLLAVAFLMLSGLPMLSQSLLSDEQNVPDAVRASDGVVAIKESPTLLAITRSSALLAAVDGAWFALLVVIVEDELGRGATTFGILLAIGSVGGIAGAALAGRFQKIPLRFVAATVFIGMGLPLFALYAFPNTVVVALALVVTSAAFAMWNVFMVSARQRASADELLGRITATYRTAVGAAALLGTLVGGLLAEAFSLRVMLLVAAVIVISATPAVTRSFRTLSPTG